MYCFIEVKKTRAGLGQGWTQGLGTQKGREIASNFRINVVSYSNFKSSETSDWMDLIT